MSTSGASRVSRSLSGPFAGGFLPLPTLAHVIRRSAALALVSGLAVVACSSDDAADSGAANNPSSAESAGATVDPAVAGDAALRDPRPRFRYPEAPPAPPADQPNPEADEAIDRIVDGITRGFFDAGGVTLLRASGDVRHGWFISDMLRFSGFDDAQLLADTFEDLTGVDLADDPDSERRPWLSVTNHLMAWDTVAYDGYVDDKAGLFVPLEGGWAPFFADDDAEIDWRLVSWGGVFIDDRPLGATERCAGGCIPALDDFPTTDASGGDWYPDERTVFGIEWNGQSVAIPLNVAEIHEMFNFTLGGRRLAVPYCTLCGSAQAYLTDQPDGSPVEGAAEVPVLRTSGLLTQSNKVMYDLVTSSVFDTFTGRAVSGPLLDAGVELEEITVVRSTWAEWKASHPDTRIVAEDGGLGRSYPLDPLGGRDLDGPIFPIGEADERLDVQELIVGIVLDDGTALAFPSEAASAVLLAGGAVELGGVELTESGDGLVATVTSTGETIAAHEAFWFAWSQFHPDTELWLPT